MERFGGTSSGLPDGVFKNPAKARRKRSPGLRSKSAEEGFNNFVDRRQERIRTFNEIATEFFNSYKLRLPNSTVFAEYAIDHLKRLLGTKMIVDFNEASVINYQNDRLDEGAAPKSVNEEVGFLLRILGEQGDMIRVRLRKKKMLKLKTRDSSAKLTARKRRCRC